MLRLLQQRYLSACVLSGGQSRRMGHDKALMPHPAGGTWLSHITGLLIELGLPVKVLSGHPGHQQQLLLVPGVEVFVEPPPWDGPLQALNRLLEQHEQGPLFMAPVDMPNLRLGALQTLISSWQQQPDIAVVAHDGHRLQPLLGIYPFSSRLHRVLVEELNQGNSSWNYWLSRIPYRSVTLPAIQLLNANSQVDLAALQR
ncbi:MAG: molybdenum cofactor guanylyltransferase [Prochlorococcus sp.]|nr:molybdenum cofactor guanylyltransferase [Prochlorococcaceae cyanobacterium ETNP14_MAG_5]